METKTIARVNNVAILAGNDSEKISSYQTDL